MLGLPYEVDIDIKKIKYPISFDHNECVHCGSKGTLLFVDIFGNKSTKEIYPFDHMICTKCNRKYSLKWERVEGSRRMKPRPVTPDLKQDFLNTTKIFDKLQRRLDE